MAYNGWKNASTWRMAQELLHEDGLMEELATFQDLPSAVARLERHAFMFRIADDVDYSKVDWEQIVKSYAKGFASLPDIPTSHY